MKSNVKRPTIITLAIFLILLGMPFAVGAQDTTPPQVTVTMPTTVQEGESFEIHIQATDDTGLWSYSVTSDEFFWVSWYPLSGTSFSRTLSVYIDDPGTYNIYITFMDDAQNERTVTRIITVLEEAPTPQPSDGTLPFILLVTLPVLAFIAVIGTFVLKKKRGSG